MALTANERKRAQIAREQEALRQLPDGTYTYLSIPFHQYLDQDGNWSDVQQCFEMMGINPPQFQDDRGPADFAFDDIFGSDQSKIDAFNGSENSIGRAEVMVGQLLDGDARVSYGSWDFKKAELNRVLVGIQQRDLTDPDLRKATMDEVVHIARLQEELEKNVRRTFPQWEIKILPPSN